MGCAGVAYMFYYLANSEPLGHQRENYLIKSRNYMDVALSYSLGERCRDPLVSFLLGSGGVFAIGALIYHDTGKLITTEKVR